MHKQFKTYKQSRGITLMMSAIVLSVVLLLTLHIMQSTMYNKENIANLKSRIQAEAAAQAAVNEGELYLQLNKPDITKFDNNCTNGLCLRQVTTSIWGTSSYWNNAKSMTSGLISLTGLSSTPKYLIEYMGTKKYQDSISVGNSIYGGNPDASDQIVYRVTGKAKGQIGKKETVIQTTIY